MRGAVKWNHRPFEFGAGITADYFAAAIKKCDEPVLRAQDKVIEQIGQTACQISNVLLDAAMGSIVMNDMKSRKPA